MLRALLAVAVLACPAFGQCGKLDFNNDGQINDDDPATFANVFAGADCATCDSIDYDGDDVYPTDRDFAEYMANYAGGPSSVDGWTPNRACGPTVIVGPRDSLQAVYQSLRWSGGTMLLPYSSRPDGVYNETVRWDNATDGMLYGNVTVKGVPNERGDRPIIRPPVTSSAGFRINAANVAIYGVRIECDHCEAGIDIKGNASRVLIEDVVIDGPVMGINIQGDNTNGGDVRIRRSIIMRTRGGEAHSQGVYVAGWKSMVLVEGCVFYDIGEETTYNQGIYSVHGPGVRIFRDNWFFDPGFAGIQARGSDRPYTVTGNVFEQCGNGFGVGHPMGAAYSVRGIFSDNLIIKPKRPFWGIALQNGDGATVMGNVLLASGAGYAFQVENPSRSLTVQGNTVSRWDRVRNYASGVTPDTDGITWAGEDVAVKPIPAIDWPMLLGRKARVWDNDLHGTAGVIERAKR